MIPLYALCARFEVLLELFVEEALKVAPPPPPTDQDEDDAEIAYEESIRRGIRTRMLAALEERLRLVGRAHPSCGLQVAAAVDLLEQARIRLSSAGGGLGALMVNDNALPYRGYEYERIADCGVNIATARLHANPTALRCVGCQDKAEHAQGGVNVPKM